MGQGEEEVKRARRGDEGGREKVRGCAEEEEEGKAPGKREKGNRADK